MGSAGSSALFGAGALLTGASTYSGIKATRAENKAQVAAANANTRRIAEDVRILENQNEANKAAAIRDNNLFTGTSIANAAANGSLFGSALDVILGNQQIQALDLLNMDYDTKLQRRALENEANMIVASSRAASKSSKNQITGQLLSGASSIARQGAQAASTGAGGGTIGSFKGIPGSS